MSAFLDTCYVGDVRDGLRAFIAAGIRAQTCVTSPPYWGLRDYGVEGQIGLEPTPQEYVERMVEVFRLVRDALADDGTLWLNLGDSYAGAPVGSFNGGGFKDASAANGGRDMSGVATSGRLNKLAASGLKPKDLVGIPWRVAFALQEDGWYLRSDIIWAKPNPMPESVNDRPTKAHEYLFLLAKRERYYYDAAAIKEPCVQDEQRPSFRGGAYINNATFDNAEGGKSTDVGNRRVVVPRGWGSDGSHSAIGHSAEGQPRKDRTAHAGKAIQSGFAGATNHHQDYGRRNKRSVWTIASEPFPDAHFATFPRALVEPCILAGSRVGDIVLDPFMGSGTTAQVAQALGRRWIGTELNRDYVAMQAKRTAQQGMALA